MNILLINQYSGNKGDRAVLYATCKLIHSINPTIKITVSTSSPEQWEGYEYYKNSHIPFIPSAWDYTTTPKNYYWKILRKFKKYTFTLMRENFLTFKLPISKLFINPSFYKATKDADIIISVGGHHYTTILSRDLVSSINFDAMSVLAMKKKLICFSQSFGPFKFYNDRNRLLTHRILSNCLYLYTREPQAKQSLIKFGIADEKIRETYETVLSLTSLFPHHTKPTEREKKIGIAIYSTQKRSNEQHSTYIHSISSFCNHAIERGYSICFFPMELKETEPDDRILIKEIILNIHNKKECSYIDQDMTTEQHLQEVSKCRLFVGHKTHSTIFALTSGTPLIGIAYHPKTIEFMKQFGVSEYAIDDNILSSSLLQIKLDKIETELDKVSRNSFERSKEINLALKEEIKLLIKQNEK